MAVEFTIEKEIMALYSERKPQQNRAIETQNKIIKAALKLFSVNGYYKTNSKAIAKEAGVSIGSFYMYYKEKKTLLLEVFNNVYNEITDTVFNDALYKKFEGKSIKESIELLVDLLYESHNIAPEFHREAIAMIYSDKDIRDLNHKEEEKVIALVIQLLKIHKSEIKANDIEAAARIIHKSTEEVIHSIKIFGSPVSDERLISELKSMLCSYLIK